PYWLFLRFIHYTMEASTPGAPREPARSPAPAVPVRRRQPPGRLLRPRRPLPPLRRDGLPAAAGRTPRPREGVLRQQRPAGRGAGRPAGGQHPPVHGAGARPP